MKTEYQLFKIEAEPNPQGDGIVVSLEMNLKDGAFEGVCDHFADYLRKLVDEQKAYEWPAK